MEDNLAKATIGLTLVCGIVDNEKKREASNKGFREVYREFYARGVRNAGILNTSFERVRNPLDWNSQSNCRHLLHTEPQFKCIKKFVLRSVSLS